MMRVYRNGYRIATLGGHASSYTDTFLHYDWQDDVTYGVRAVTSYAVLSIVTVEVDHCN
jgi:hypothetical protein